jgi:c-di-GMP-binding flagellar brake protein YcgR
MTQSLQDNARDRRRFFRIDDAVRFAYRPLTAAELEAGVARLNEGMGGAYALMASLAAISQRVSVSLRRIEHQNAEVAHYLKALDQKIDTVARTLLVQGSDLAAKRAEPVNLSAGGLAIPVREGLDPGTPVEVRLLLLPSLAGILAYGAVVECGAPSEQSGFPDGSRVMRIDFTHIRDEDRDLLIRHMLRRQGEHLRRQREAADEDGD